MLPIAAFLVEGVPRARDVPRHDVHDPHRCGPRVAVQEGEGAELA
jgi:hypothetical protein